MLRWTGGSTTRADANRVRMPLRSRHQQQQQQPCWDGAVSMSSDSRTRWDGAATASEEQQDRRGSVDLRLLQMASMLTEPRRPAVQRGASTRGECDGAGMEKKRSRSWGGDDRGVLREHPHPSDDHAHPPSSSSSTGLLTLRDDTEMGRGGNSDPVVGVVAEFDASNRLLVQSTNGGVYDPYTCTASYPAENGAAAFTWWQLAVAPPPSANWPNLHELEWSGDVRQPISISPPQTVTWCACPGPGHLSTSPSSSPSWFFGLGAFSSSWSSHQQAAGLPPSGYLHPPSSPYGPPYGDLQPLLISCPNHSISVSSLTRTTTAFPTPPSYLA